MFLRDLYFLNSHCTIRWYTFSASAHTRPIELDNNILFVKSGTLTHLDLPCRSTSVSSLSKSSNIEVKLETHMKGIKFYPNKNFSDDAKFKVKCGNRHFEVKLQSNNNVLSLFQKLNLFDGKLIIKKLSTHEKLINDVEKKLGIRIIDN
jgi:hypothetical protein